MNHTLTFSPEIGKVKNDEIDSDDSPAFEVRKSQSSLVIVGGHQTQSKVRDDDHQQ